MWFFGIRFEGGVLFWRPEQALEDHFHQPSKLCTTEYSLVSIRAILIEFLVSYV